MLTPQNLAEDGRRAIGAELSVGCNFDPVLIERIVDLNGRHLPNRVVEFFGSIREHDLLTARPAYRLPEVEWPDLVVYLSLCHQAGLKFNYTLNAPYLGRKADLAVRASEIEGIIGRLIDAGVDVFTVSHPLMAEAIRRVSAHVAICVSTIAHVDAILQMEIWKREYGATVICGAIGKNRHVAFLRRAAQFCRSRDIVYEVIANEFCGLGVRDGSGAATQCIYRDSCFLCHSENQTALDDQLFSSYPMGRCLRARQGDVVWLKMPFIRPEDIESYLKLGIQRFKITGRTGETGYILQVTEAYLLREWTGKLAELWRPLEAINPALNAVPHERGCGIDNRSLHGFVDWWFDHPEHDCAANICGETCNHCDNFFAGIRPNN